MTTNEEVSAPMTTARAGQTDGAPPGWYIDIGERLAELRTTAGLTQAELAAVLGVSGDKVRTIEVGLRRPSAWTLLQLSRALGVSLDRLVSGVDNSDPLVPTVTSNPWKALVTYLTRSDAGRQILATAAHQEAEWLAGRLQRSVLTVLRELAKHDPTTTEE